MSYYLQSRNSLRLPSAGRSAMPRQPVGLGDGGLRAGSVSAWLQRSAARPPIPDLLPGEDRAFGAGLFVDMIPRSCWFTNVRTCVTPQDWERLRHMITRRADRRCEACGACVTLARPKNATDRPAASERAFQQEQRRSPAPAHQQPVPAPAPTGSYHRGWWGRVTGQ